MDIGAYMQKDLLEGYVEKHYGIPPRPRGYRLMKVTEPEFEFDDYQMEIFNEYCGKDVIYIHTRCGKCEDGGPDSNYYYFGMDEYEDQPLFLEGIDDTFDCTYRDSYFAAVVDDEYLELVKKYGEN